MPPGHVQPTYSRSALLCCTRAYSRSAPTCRTGTHSRSALTCCTGRYSCPADAALPEHINRRATRARTVAPPSPGHVEVLPPPLCRAARPAPWAQKSISSPRIMNGSAPRHLEQTKPKHRNRNEFAARRVPRRARPHQRGSRSRSLSGGSRTRQEKRQATLSTTSLFFLDERAKAAAPIHIHQGALPGVPVIHGCVVPPRRSTSTGQKNGCRKLRRNRRSISETNLLLSADLSTTT